jgi:O-acetyl-ADP-ribose deacetylase (regulator of RNase III)
MDDEATASAEDAPDAQQQTAPQTSAGKRKTPVEDEAPEVIARCLGAGGEFDLGDGRARKRKRFSAVDLQSERAEADDGVERVLCGYELASGVLLCSSGSVVGFRGGAVVNAANEGCQGGGGVDGAITAAGGDALADARAALPAIDADGFRRCATGDAVVTAGGDLAADHCIHAVGPNYGWLERGDGEDEEATLARGDALLAGAYAASMARAAEVGATTVAFSLLSAGIFRGARSLAAVLAIAVAAVARGAYPGLERVHLVAFTPREQKTLAQAAQRHFLS